MPIAVKQGAWFIWDTSSALIVTLQGFNIVSLYLTFTPVSIIVTPNATGNSFTIPVLATPQTVSVPSGNISLTLTSLPGYTLYVFASTSIS